jgi:predicted  nucleic acid-binding Zn-ribbon protein
MDALDQQFNTLNDKLQQLLKHMGHLQKENGQLRTELQQAREREAAAQAQVDELKQQAAILKFAAGEMNDKDKKEFELTISRYIRQLDKCIAYLSQ